MAIVHPMLCILIAGAASGAALSVYAPEILNFLRIVVTLVRNNPMLVTAIWALIEMLINYMRRQNQPGQIQDNHHEN